MTTPLCRPSPLVLVLISILAWMVVLGAILLYLFGAKVTEVWLIAGGFFSMAALSFLVLAKELCESILLPSMRFLGNRYESFQKAGTAKPADAGIGDDHLIDPSFSGPRRSALGLCDQRVPLNRQRKSGGRRSSVAQAGSAGYALQG